MSRARAGALTPLLAARRDRQEGSVSRSTGRSRGNSSDTGSAMQGKVDVAVVMFPSGQVDAIYPGCPPTAEALVYGLLQMQNKIRLTNTIAR